MADSLIERSCVTSPFCFLQKGRKGFYKRIHRFTLGNIVEGLSGEDIALRSEGYFPTEGKKNKSISLKLLETFHEMRMTDITQYGNILYMHPTARISSGTLSVETVKNNPFNPGNIIHHTQPINKETFS